MAEGILKFSVGTAGKTQLREALMAKARLVSERILEESSERLVARTWPVESKKGTILTSITDTGALLQSGKIIEVSDGYFVRYTEPYAWTVEYGMRKGVWVPVSALQKWAQRKGGVSAGDSKSVSYAMQRKIHDEGITPRPFLEEAFYAAISKLA